MPATGKSTIANELLRRDRDIAYVRIDRIEQALRDSGEMGSDGVQGAGYIVARALVRDLLRSPLMVLVECVNPLEFTRAAWRRVAADAGSGIFEIEIVCGDAEQHRLRAQSREVDVPGLVLPDWGAIRTREYEPWHAADLRLDTAVLSPGEAADRIRAALVK